MNSMAFIVLACALACLFYLYLDLNARFEALMRYVKALEAKMAKDDDLTEQL